ncbi:MAG: DIP1984 family protein [Treponema sp.]|nr:DIP1984 family protein [Treponema sp.]
MKLAEALQERADLNKKIDSLNERLQSNAIVQEGEKPAEDPALLMEELDSAVLRLEEIVARINITNSRTIVDGKSITQLIAKKDALQKKAAIYRNVVSQASQTARRATRSEIKILSAVDVQALQKKVDALSKEIRVTDNTIQELNWKTELL